MEFAIWTILTLYNPPNAYLRGHVCRTNIPSATAFRGFGKPQTDMIMETIMCHIADVLGMDKTIVQEVNFVKDGDQLVFGTTVENCTIQKCWSTLLDQCKYVERRKAIGEFNK